MIKTHCNNVVVNIKPIYLNKHVFRVAFHSNVHFLNSLLKSLKELQNFILRIIRMWSLFFQYGFIDLKTALFASCLGKYLSVPICSCLYF